MNRSTAGLDPFARRCIAAGAMLMLAGIVLSLWLTGIAKKPSLGSSLMSKISGMPRPRAALLIARVKGGHSACGIRRTG